jgi:hypothetical protein
MIDRILMELYDECYANNSDDALVEFAKKTFPNDGTEKLFVGCVLILFGRANGFKARYDCTREKLLAILLSTKVKIGNTNLLAFYVDRINTERGVGRYLNKIVKDDNLDKYAGVVIDYLEQFRPRFIEDIQKYEDKIKEYIEEV